MRGNLKEIFFKHPEKILQTVLGLVAIHSLGMGLTLIAQPAVLMKFAGFNPDGEHFFPTQGGVFHLLLFVVYLMGASHIEKYHHFIVFSIFVKAVATIFLMMYCVAAEFKWVVFISGIGDGAMGLMIFLAFQHYLRSTKFTALGVKNE
jgi:hypothetical protein